VTCSCVPSALASAGSARHRPECGFVSIAPAPPGMRCHSCPRLPSQECRSTAVPMPTPDALTSRHLPCAVTVPSPTTADPRESGERGRRSRVTPAHPSHPPAASHPTMSARAGVGSSRFRTASRTRHLAAAAGVGAPRGACPKRPWRPGAEGNGLTGGRRAGGTAVRRRHGWPAGAGCG